MHAAPAETSGSEYIRRYVRRAKHNDTRAPAAAQTPPDGIGRLVVGVYRPPRMRRTAPCAAHSSGPG